MKKISPNVFIETGFSGANVGIVQTTEGLVMIDTPWRPTDAIKWREEISNKGNIRYLINTDEHHDHNLCNCFSQV